MIALDTNALLRWIVADEPDQHRRVAEALKRAAARSPSVFIPEIVTVEAVWTLQRRYKLSRAETVDALQQLLSNDFLVMEHETLIAQALLAFARGRGDFSHYLIREHSRAAQAKPILSFDEALLGEADFKKP